MKYRALITEPEKGNRERLARIMRDAGLEPLPTASVGEALEAVRVVSFEVALVEFALPDHTALELLDMISLFNNRARSVVLVSDQSTEVRMKVMRAGAFSVIRKPFTDDVVLYTINEIIRKFF